MGCVSSKKNAKEEAEEAEELLHTNSMLFTKEAINAAKQSLQAERDAAARTSQDVSPDNSKVLTSCMGEYKVGDTIEYAPVMSSPLIVDSGENFKVEFGYRSLQGRSALPPCKPNQDSVVVFKLDGKPDHIVFGVFDGHGPYGDHPSHYCRMKFHEIMLEVYKEKGDDIDPVKLLTETISRIHNTFIETSYSKTGVDPHVSGTTLIVAMIIGTKVYVANVGDSRCVMGESGGKKVKPMSVDHKPERESEKKRLLESNAILLSEGELRGGKKREGKQYVCRKDPAGNILYGVLFTRSIGDLDAHESLGISAEPEFEEALIEPESEQVFILASDGVWDQMANDEAVKYVYSAKDALEASEKIQNVSASRWDNDKYNARRDDITVCVVKIVK